MPGLLPNIDPDGLLEYSVVFTDRSLNHMSRKFRGVMNDISVTLKGVYNASGVVVVPGGGTFGMEAVARQFARDKRCLVIRNGYFSFRWSQILETARLTDRVTVLKAAPVSDKPKAPFVPAPLEDVVARIEAERPEMVFAPHVETSSGMLLPDDYVAAVAAATHAVGGMFVLDCIASGTVWVDMRELGVDVLISAPQKGWSSTPCGALVMLGETAMERIETTASDSFACDLKMWLNIMRTYEDGAHAYHATMPTDGLKQFRNTMLDTGEFGFEKARDAQWELGEKVRELMESRGFNSVAAQGFQAPGVVVSYTDNPEIQNGAKFMQAGLQIAAGVPLMCDEPADYRSFRLGLFGLDKLMHVDRTVSYLERALEAI